MFVGMRALAAHGSTSIGNAKTATRFVDAKAPAYVS
jgi:hypothetical protein